MKKFVILFTGLIFVLCGNLMAEIKTYESTENAGQNKKERIDSVESYLIDLSNSLKSMETKLDENAKKIKALDDVVKALKEAQAKKADEKLGEKRAAPTAEAKAETSEMEKLKADILTLKNQDIEKLKVNLEELSDTVKIIQANLREKNK